MLLLYALAAALLILWLRYGQKSHIPTLVGSKGLISSYLAALRFLRRAPEIISQGYCQDPNGVFRVPMLFRWVYVANGRSRAMEVGSAPDHILSFLAATADTFQTHYTMGPEITRNEYHVLALRGWLTRNIGHFFPQLRDEIVNAFDHILGLHDNEWKLVEVLPTALQVVTRTSNRIFVGLPVCREPEYLQLNIDYSILVFTRGQIIGLIPNFLKPIFAPLFSTRKRSLQQALKFLGPLIDERLEKENQYGRDWPGRPNDFISRLLDLAEGDERTTSALALRILVTNVSATHTTATTLTDALYDLTAYPDHIMPMREEAERVIAAEGWTKAALGKMHKIDSFLRESMRLRAPGPVSMARKVLSKDGFTFSDGKTVPYGSFVTVSTAVHHDVVNYDNADMFDGFRFSRLRQERGGLIANDGAGENPGVFNRHMVSTAPDHIVFGYGRHACPGRFFAAAQLKAMLAHILINYEIKAETDVRPPDICIELIRTPNPRGKIWIRKRK
ncbi:cytochrome P450 [Mycena leptocephala]|nr:cytochrome P450 [Mycena leptocephala]